MQEFTSAGGEREWETFTFSNPITVSYSFEIVAVSGPSFDDKPDYPTLRVGDFQVVGELTKDPGVINVRGCLIFSALAGPPACPLIP